MTIDRSEAARAMPKTMLENHSLDYWHRVTVGRGGSVPCSVYGRDSEECAWWAIAAALVVIDANGEDDVRALLDGLMSDAVNDRDGIAELVWDGWHVIPRSVKRMLGTDRRTIAREMLPDSYLADRRSS